MQNFVANWNNHLNSMFIMIISVKKGQLSTLKLTADSAEMTTNSIGFSFVFGPHRTKERKIHRILSNKEKKNGICHINRTNFLSNLFSLIAFRSWTNSTNWTCCLKIRSHCHQAKCLLFMNVFDNIDFWTW